jgi:phage terminase large subunit-like protein
VIGRDGKRANWLHWSHAWAHPSVLERRKSEAARFRDFEKDGDLTIVERSATTSQSGAIVSNRTKAGLLDKVGVDPAGVGRIVDALMEENIGRSGSSASRRAGS